jgi:hypothetical protein
VFWYTLNAQGKGLERCGSCGDGQVPSGAGAGGSRAERAVGRVHGRGEREGGRASGLW